MTTIRISQVNAGQQVAADVKDRSGRILLRAGSELTEKNIKIIKSWGVVEIDVTGDLPEAELPHQSGQVTNDKLHAIELDLSKRFRFVNRSHPLIHELFEICLLRESNNNREG